MAFKLTVLGASGTFPTPDVACAGYLMEAEGERVWLDAGPGTFANLQRHADFWKLRALVLSHLHPDHILDIFPFYYAMRYSDMAEGTKGFEVYGPPGVEEHLKRVISIEEESDFAGVLVFHEVSPAEERSIGPFRIRFERSVHPIMTLAMRVEAEGRVLAYTADSGPSDDVARLVEGADMLICEATMQEPEDELGEVHMTAEEAGELASKAGVEKLVLTHIWPGLAAEVSVELAKTKFGGEVIVAADNLQLEV